MEPLKVTVAELEAISGLLLEHLRELEGEEIELKWDYYWDIFQEHRFDPYNRPRTEDLTLGQLSFDIENLRELRADRELVVGYALVWLGELLKALGFQANP